MERQLLVSIPEYHEYAMKPQNFEDLCARISRKCGLWQIIQRDKRTGAVLLEMWSENAITDNGALALWKNTINASSAAIAVANIIAIDQSLTYTTLAANIAAGGTVTSIQVGSLTGPTIANGSQLVIGAGTSNLLTVTLTQAITGAGTYTVSSVAGPVSQINAGANIKMVPTTADASALSSPVAYTAALPVGQFSFSGSGVGNRQMQVTNSGNYLFSTTANSNPATAPAGNYTAAWIVNTNPVTSTAQTFVHIAFDAPLAINSSTTGQVTIVEKI